MKIGINASFVRKPGTGIGQVSLNFIKELATISSKSNSNSRNHPPRLPETHRRKAGKLTDNRYILYLEEPLPKSLKLPNNFETRVFLPFWKRDDLIRKILWEKHLLPKMARKDKCDIFFSLYQCPTVMPKNIRHIMLVHDLIPRLFPEYLNNSRKRKYQKLTEIAIREADHLIANSRRTEKDIIRELSVPGKKITTNYIDTDPRFNRKPTGEQIAKILRKHRLKPGYILGGMGLEKRKNIEGLMRAYKELLDKNTKENFLNKISEKYVSIP